jgi:hypothetical protein
MGHVFISYSSRDKERVSELVSALKVEGHQIWWDDDITPGGDWDLEIQRALEQSRAVLVVWSENAMKSREVRAEATYALSENKLLPVRIEPVKIWARYNMVQYEDVLGRPVTGDPNWPSVIRMLKSRAAARSRDSGHEATEPERDVSDRPVLPPGILAPAVLMSASGLCLIASALAPLSPWPETELPVYAAIGFAALAVGFVASSLTGVKGSLRT